VAGDECGATWLGGALMLLLAALEVGSGCHLRPVLVTAEYRYLPSGIANLLCVV
jgi:hypothetical protein